MKKQVNFEETITFIDVSYGGILERTSKMKINGTINTELKLTNTSQDKFYSLFFFSGKVFYFIIVTTKDI